MALRIIFMGTPDFSVPALAALHEAGYEIVAVYTQPPRPKGRGQQVQPSPVQIYAEENRLEVYHPKTLKMEDAQRQFAAFRADVAVVAAYGLILPKAVLEAPKYGCINIHASILPRWRGASPIQRAIWAGDSASGVTLMQMDEGLDTGPMIAMEKIPLDDKTTASSLHDALSALGSKMIVEAAAKLERDGKLAAQEQDDEETTYAPLLKKEDGRINFDRPAKEIDRQIRALNPWPGTFCETAKGRVKIPEAQYIAETTTQAPGTILDRTGNIACGNGSVLRILKLQPEGKKPMDFSSALNGGYVKPGDKLS